MQVDFYILSSNTQNERLLFSCRLIEKVYQKHKKISILCQDQTMLDELDQLLWSYKDISFIPHLPFDDKLSDKVSVKLLLDQANISNDCEIIIKLQNKPFNSHAQIDYVSRVLEIVDKDQTVLESSRENFKDYKACGFKVNVHKLD